jgi:hypothetical protein
MVLSLVTANSNEKRKIGQNLLHWIHLYRGLIFQQACIAIPTPLDWLLAWLFGFSCFSSLPGITCSTDCQNSTYRYFLF